MELLAYEVNDCASDFQLRTAVCALLAHTSHRMTAATPSTPETTRNDPATTLKSESIIELGSVFGWRRVKPRGRLWPIG